MKENGELIECPLARGWHDKIEETIMETHTMISSISEHTGHLKNLDTIAHAVSDIKNGLLASATSKDQIATKTVLTIMKIFGWVILGLTITIVFLLTGAHLGWFQIH